MKNLAPTICLVIASLFLSASTSFALPTCPTNTNTIWTDCQGTFQASFGDNYDGEWKDNNYHGKGTLIYANGDKYVGDFAFGNPNGKGTKFYANGKIANSFWKNDKFQQTSMAPSLDFTQTCAEDLTSCNTQKLCHAATLKRNGGKVWDERALVKSYITTAQNRGYTCGVSGTNTTTASNTSSYTSTSSIRNAFKGDSALKRKQIQYALKKLNYYNSSIDALYGPGTERALTGYAKGLNGRSPHSIFSSVLSQVSVPSSFAVARRSSSNSSSSSSPLSGLTAIVSSPSVPANQAIAICQPMARAAASNASNSYQAPQPRKSYSANCSSNFNGYNCRVRDSTISGGFAGGLANGLSRGLVGKSAGKRVYQSCLASYGWRK